MVLGGGTIADLIPREHRGTAMAVWMMGPSKSQSQDRCGHLTEDFSHWTLRRTYHRWLPHRCKRMEMELLVRRYSGMLSSRQLWVTKLTPVGWRILHHVPHSDERDVCPGHPGKEGEEITGGNRQRQAAIEIGQRSSHKRAVQVLHRSTGQDANPLHHLFRHLALRRHHVYVPLHTLHNLHRRLHEPIPLARRHYRTFLPRSGCWIAHRTVRVHSLRQQDCLETHRAWRFQARNASADHVHWRLLSTHRPADIRMVCKLPNTLHGATCRYWHHWLRAAHDFHAGEHIFDRRVYDTRRECDGGEYCAS